MDQFNKNKIYNLFSKAFFVVILFVTISCSDEGCIDADDFGEYESQTIEVSANSSAGSCEYDDSKPIDDSSQGSGIKECLVSGDVQIENESGQGVTSKNGCSGFLEETNSKERRICVENCIQKCVTKNSTNPESGDSEWVSTTKKISGRNSGVTIEPGSEIRIKAAGSISFGGSLSYPNIFVRADDAIPDTYNVNWNSNFIDTKANQSVSMEFSGEWMDSDITVSELVKVNNTNPVNTTPNTTDPNANTTTDPNATTSDVTYELQRKTLPTQILLGHSTDKPQDTYLRELYNGARKVGIYTINHPDGYSFDYNSQDEKSGTKNVPLLPDFGAITCEYEPVNAPSGEVINKYEAYCSYQKNGYGNIGYSKVDESLAAKTFPISSLNKSVGLGYYGGMIRWYQRENSSNTSSGANQLAEAKPSDKLYSEKHDPFMCNGVVCEGSSDFDPDNGGMLVKIMRDGGSIIGYDQNVAYKVSFKSLESPPATCGNIKISGTLEIKNPGSSNFVQYDKFKDLIVSNTSWSSGLTLEAGARLVISKIESENNISGCNQFIAVRMLRYHDIQIQKSGFVRFTTINGSADKYCNLKGRIVNPRGKLIDETFDGKTVWSDFYEYGNFSDSNSKDPLESLSVPSSANEMRWSDSFFVRNGQVIRFSPESWNQDWLSNKGKEKSCGIGMAMSIKPRPALLCRGFLKEDLISSSDCILDFNDKGNLIGCKADESKCRDTKSNSYCNFDSSKTTIQCNDGVSPIYAKSSCSIDFQFLEGVKSDKSSCDSCKAIMLQSLQLPAKKGVYDVIQCYDLENYDGKVSNIPNKEKIEKQEINDFLSNYKISKGAKKLEPFYGKYGNLDNFIITPKNDSDTGNKIYKMKELVTFDKSARLKTFIIDGEDFNGNYGFKTAYIGNSSHAGKYDGRNGVKINLESSSTFNNGQFLEIRLCQENEDSYICSGANPKQISTQPNVVKLKIPEINSGNMNAMMINYETENYGFNDYGFITKNTSTIPNFDCDIPNVIKSEKGSAFYCHTHLYKSEDELSKMTDSEKKDRDKSISNLRLSFRIYDPQQGNCDLPDSEANSKGGVLTENPFYDPTRESKDSTCSKDDKPGENGCKKYYYCASKYNDNSGKYYVNVKVKTDGNKKISNMISSVITPIVEVMDGKRDNPDTKDKNEATMGQAERIYRLLITDSAFQSILQMCLVVMFTFYGVGYLMGISELNHSEIINRVIKIGVIYLFVGEQGWEWFNNIIVKFFKDGTDYVAFMMASAFDESPSIKTAIANNSYYDKSILFSSVDRVFGLFFAPAVQKKVSALLFADIFGWAYLLIIYSSFMLYIHAIANAVLLYLTSQVFISILFVVAPIFFVFLVLNQTKEMFDNWLKQLIGFSLQQIFLLTTLAFFNMLMYEVIKMSLGYKICWDEVWVINIVTRISLLSFWTISSLPPRTNPHSEVGNIGHPEGIPSIFSILFIWVIASLMQKFISFMTDMASSLSGSLSASSLGSGVSNFAQQMKGAASKLMSQAWDKTGGQVTQRLDKALFDSGKLADKEREEKKKANAIDNKNRRSMGQAADKALDKYKKNNASKLAGMTKEDRKKTLDTVRQEALKKKGEELGLNEGQIKKLLDKKGLEYSGSNLFGLAAQVMKQGVMREGSLFTSLREEKANSGFTSSQVKEGLSKMNASQRKDFIDKIKKNEIKETKTGISGLVQSIKSMGKSPLAKMLPGGTKHSAEYDKAAKQLVEEGKIPKAWTNALRSDDEKKMIRERMKENKSRSKVNSKIDNSSIGFALDAQATSNYLDDKEKNIKESGNVVGTIKSLGSKLKEMTQTSGLRAMFQSKERKNEMKSISKDKLGYFGGQISDELENTKQEMATVSERQKDLQDQLGGLSLDGDSKEKYDELTQLRDKVKGRMLPSVTNSNDLKRIKELEGDEKISEFESKQSKIHGSINESKNHMQDLEKKFKELGGIDDAIHDTIKDDKYDKINDLGDINKNNKKK